MNVRPNTVGSDLDVCAFQYHPPSHNSNILNTQQKTPTLKKFLESL